MASSPEVSLGVTADEPPEALFCSLASTSDQDGGLGSAPLPPTTPAAAAAAAAADNGTPPQAQDGRGIVQVRRVSTAGLFVVAFFLSSGGIYANEPLVLAAPPSFVFGGLLLALVLFGLPLGLISIEMGTAFPQDGGMVVWIDEAFGTRVGKYFYYFNWLGHLVDAAVYPVFAGEFLTEYQSSPLIMKLVPSLTVLFLTGIKLAGTKVFVRFGAVLFFVSSLPALLYVCIGLKGVGLKDLTDSSGQGSINWSLYLSYLYWLLSGFADVGVLCGEVKDPGRSLVIVVAALLPIGLLVVALPLWVSLSLESDRTLYEPGFFNTLAERLTGEWLSYTLLVGAIVCQLGLYNSFSLAAERVTSHALSYPARVRAVRKSLQSVGLSLKMVSYVTGAVDTGTGVPPLCIVFNAAFAFAFVWLPYDVLVEMAALTTSIVMLAGMAAFATLRFTKPWLPRPWCIPGGKFVAVLMLVPGGALTAAIFYFTLTDDEPVVGVPYFRPLALAVAVLPVLVVCAIDVCVGFDRQAGRTDTVPLLGDCDSAAEKRNPTQKHQTQSQDALLPPRQGSKDQIIASAMPPLCLTLHEDASLRTRTSSFREPKCHPNSVA
eukprot:m.287674 g.287674  ORF g.287674 m.287674 type:complete len:602 (+) comp19446_c0_seq3:766-2571(+)